MRNRKISEAIQNLNDETKLRLREAFERLIVDPHSRTYWEAELLLLGSDVEAAKAKLQMAVESGDEEVRSAASHLLGLLSEEAGDNETALGLFRAAGSLGADVHYLSELGRAELKAQNYLESERVFREALQSVKDEADLFAVQFVALDYVELLFQTNRGSEAVNLMENLVASFPDRYELRTILDRAVARLENSK